MRKLLVFGFIGLLTWCGCRKGEEGTGNTGSSDKNIQANGSLFGSFSPQAELQALQGKWKVRDAADSDEQSIWTIDNDVLVRHTGEKTTEGKIEIVSPGMIAFVIHEGDGTMREYFGYARNGADIYIGTGVSGAKLSDRYVVADEGVVVLTGSVCKHYKKSGLTSGFEKVGVTVTCAIKEEKGKQVLTYRLPDSSTDDPNSIKSVQIVGTALLDEHMKESIVTKVTDSTTQENSRNADN